MSNYKRGVTSDETYKKIKNMMYYNELSPGQKIVYQDLAERLNTSITPVIQALKRLEDSNLVQYKPNKGYFIKEITKDEVKELYEAREALEIYIVPSIVQNLNSEKLSDIKKSFKDYNKTTKDHRLLIIRDSQFHLKIAKFAHNNVIYRLLNGIFDEICLKYRPEYMGDERIAEAVQEHRRILNALEKRDVEKVVAMTKEHNGKGREHVISSLCMDRPIIF